jgi:hypothetical protein
LTNVNRCVALTNYRESGDQYLSISGGVPSADDPSLWAVLELVR